MILVTGSTGMLGGHLIRELLLHNNRIAALSRHSSDRESLKKIFAFYGDDADAFFNRVIWKEGDVEDYNNLSKAFEGIEFVYHCAAMVSLGKSNESMLRVNVDGTKNIVDAALAARVKKICFVSSIAALTDGNGQNEIDEESMFRPDEKSSVYGLSKRMAENEILKGIDNGLKAVIVNPGVIIGYSKNMTGSGELFKRVKAGLPFYTNGVTGYISVQDVVKAMILLMNSQISRERYILVGENKSHKDVLSDIADGYGKYRPFIGMKKSLIFSAHVLDFLGKLFGFTPLIDSSSARVAISRKSYSSMKFLSQFPDFRFSGIRKSVLEICEFDKRFS